MTVSSEARGERMRDDHGDGVHGGVRLSVGVVTEVG